MGTALALFSTLLLSTVTALLAALQLGDFFQTAAGLTVVLVALPAFAVFTMLAFAAAYAGAPEAGVLHRVAIFLAIIAMGLTAIPVTAELVSGQPRDPFDLRAEDIQVVVLLLVPALLVILIQWGLVRRQWLQARSDEDMSRWPWAMTIVAGFLVLNPIGLEFVGAALRQSTPAVIAGTVCLVAIALLECYIRVRMLRRRGAAA